MNSPPPDPLSALKDIHLPSAISEWPSAPGWWLLSVFMVFLVAFLLLKTLNRWRAGAYRRAALRELKQLQKHRARGGDDLDFLQQVNQLLRRTALQAYPQAKVAALSGDDWVDFLARQSNKAGDFQCLGQQAYRANPDLSNATLERLGKACQRWIRQHRRQAC